jgi:hypothetical protein
MSKYAMPELAAWFESMHYVLYGFARWHSRSPRYRALHETDEDGVRIRVVTMPIA